MKNWTVRQRIVLSFSVTVALMFVVGAVAFYFLRSIARETTSIEQDSIAGLFHISRVQAAALSDYALSEQYALRDNKAELDASEAQLRVSRAALDTVLRGYEATIFTTRDRELFDAIKSALAGYTVAQAEMRKFGAEFNLEEVHSAAAKRVQPEFAKVQAAIQAEVDANKSNAEASVSRVHAAIAAAYTGITVGLAIAVLLGVLSGVVLVRAVTRPLERLVGVVETMRQGDFTHRVKVERSDEFGALGEGFNRMTDELTTLIGGVQKSGVLVATSITEIAATAKEQQATANEVAATTTEISATAKEISATARDLAQTVAHVSEGAQQAATLADSGRESIGRMDETMRRVSDAAGGINSRLTVLNDKAANIGSVVTTIAKVADQTNLLSLNAAIEAEKAGEYGRGFAVVATEIRRLADQTAAATVDIEQLVKEIQSAVTAGVMGMDKFSEEVRRGVSEVEKVAGQLAQIIQHVQSITPRISSVSEGMQAQSTGAEQISQALAQLGEAARQTAESLRQSNDIVRSLDEAARGLRSGIERFKVEN